MIKLRVETVARDGRPTLPGRSQFQESGRRNRLERGCQGTGLIVENQIRQPLIWFSLWLVPVESNIYLQLVCFTKIRQEMVEVCLTVKNLWGLLTEGDDGVCFSGVYFTFNFPFPHFPRMFPFLSYSVMFQNVPSLNSPIYSFSKREVSVP